MLVSFALPNANFSRHPQSESVEYRLRWVPNANFSRWACTFHIFCVDFICIWWPTQTQCKPSIQWDMGLSHSVNFLAEGYLCISDDYSSILVHLGDSFDSPEAFFLVICNIFINMVKCYRNIDDRYPLNYVSL